MKERSGLNLHHVQSEKLASPFSYFYSSPEVIRLLVLLSAPISNAVWDTSRMGLIKVLAPSDFGMFGSCSDFSGASGAMPADIAASPAWAAIAVSAAIEL